MRKTDVAQLVEPRRVGSSPIIRGHFLRINSSTVERLAGLIALRKDSRIPRFDSSLVQ